MGHFHVLISWMLSCYHGGYTVYRITTQCLNGTLVCVDFMDTVVCVDFMDVIMGDIPYNHTVFEWDTCMC